MAITNTKPCIKMIQKELPHPGELFDYHKVPEKWSDIKSNHIRKFDIEEDATTILKKMPKNTAIHSLVQFIDVAASKNVDLRPLFDMLMDEKTVKWTLAAEYLVTYKTNESDGWTIDDFMDIVQYYSKMRCMNLANEFIDVTIERFGSSAVANYEMNLNHLYIANRPKMCKRRRKLNRGELHPNPDELLRHANVELKKKMKLVGIPRFQYLAQYMTDKMTLRGAEHIKDHIKAKFFKNFIEPASYLSLEGLLAARRQFKRNNTLHQHEAGIHILLYGHDGFNRLNNMPWRRVIWNGQNPCSFAAKHQFDTSKPFKPFHDLDMVTIPKEELKEIITDMSNIYPVAREILNDLSAMQVN